MALSRRAYFQRRPAKTWQEIWEAGPYYRKLSRALEDAKHYAILVGWQIDSRLVLDPEFPRERPNETLREKVVRLCEEKPGFQVYFLIWDHAYFYTFEREFWQGRRWDDIHPRVHFVFDNRHPLGGSHHEKICLIDGELAYCGGIDLCNDRWDTPRHRYEDARRSLSRQNESHGPYHDIAVRVTGPICQDIHRHVARRWRKLSTIRFPRPVRNLQLSEPDAYDVFFSRTIARLEYPGMPGPSGPAVTREVEFLFRDLIQQARRSLVLEGQYYWSKQINDLLITKLLERRNTGFELVLVLADLSRVSSPTRRMYSYELSLLEKLEAAAEFTGTRLVLVHPLVGERNVSANASPAKSIYVHSKVIIVDDLYLSIGSANLATRAFRIDTELHLTLEGNSRRSRAHIRRFKRKLLRHWNLGNPSGAVQAIAIRPRLQLMERRRRRWLAVPPSLSDTWAPWPLGFDPKMPWLFPMRRSLRRTGARLASRLSRGRKSKKGRTPSLVVGPLLLSSSAAAFAAAVLAHLSPEAALCAAVLSAAWYLPVPFVAGTALSALTLGAKEGSQAVLIALWIATLWAYVLGRSFPRALHGSLSRFHSGRSIALGRRWLGRRSFEGVVRLLFDPRIPVSLKLGLQGLFAVPLPWLVLGSGLLLPSLFINWMRLCTWIWLGIAHGDTFIPDGN